jgi:hypothetical protein
MRLLGARLGEDLVPEVAKHGDVTILAELRRRFPAVDGDFAACSAEARAQLVAERGDPTPYRLA